MGIQGLTTFIARNADRSLEPYDLHDQSLVIDGNSLSVQLYQSSSKLNSAFGGDYDVYARTVKKFFCALAKCKISPYVIFDGGYEDKKMNTVLKRFSGRIVDASRLNPQNESRFLVLPLLLKDVFVEVLESCKVPFTFCEFEADSEIAAVGRYLQCPVLSYDSDFFVFNVDYIPFPTLTLKPAIYKTNEGSHYVLKCKIYKAENFDKLFPGVDHNLLPLIATLLGNDYVKRSVFSKFYDNLKQSKSKKVNEGQRRIVAVIEWLQNESLHSATEKVLSHFKLYERPRIQRAIIGSCASYTYTFCDSLKNLGLISSHEYLTVENTVDEVNLKKEIYNSGPAWVLNILKTGKISPRFYDLLHKSFYIGMPQVEDFLNTDSNLSSLPILRFSFDIITSFDKRELTLQCRNGIKQRQRNFTYTPYISDGEVDSWTTKDKSPGPSMFLNFLGKTIENNLLTDAKKLPNNLQMIIITILWMMKSTDSNTPVPNEAQVSSLILSYITISLMKPQVDEYLSSYEFNSKYSNEIKTWSDSSNDRWHKVIPGFEGLDTKHVIYEDCMMGLSKLLKYFEVDTKLREFPKVYKRQYLHFYAQFQCCLQQLSYLNILTLEPFSACRINEAYNGTFLYNMYVTLKSRDNPGSYVYELLKFSPTILNYFTVIFNFLGFNTCIPPQKNLASKKLSNKKSKKHIEVSSSTEESDSNESILEDVDDMHDFNNKYNALNFIE